jgi:hypothetical protein
MRYRAAPCSTCCCRSNTWTRWLFYRFRAVMGSSARSPCSTGCSDAPCSSGLGVNLTSWTYTSPDSIAQSFQAHQTIFIGIWLNCIQVREATSSFKHGRGGRPPRSQGNLHILFFQEVKPHRPRSPQSPRRPADISALPEHTARNTQPSSVSSKA